MFNESFLVSMNIFSLQFKFGSTEAAKNFTVLHFYELFPSSSEQYF